MARNPLIRKNPKMTGKTTGGHKSAGILDDHAVRKNIATREGTIEKVPVNASDIVNKKYVDDITIGTYFDFYAYDDASDIGGYKEFKLTPSTGAKVEGDVSVLGNAAGQMVGARITEDTIDIPALMTNISSGVATFHIHAKAATANRLKIYAEIYTRTGGGVETLICTTALSHDYVGTTETGHNLHGNILESIPLAAGDRLVIKGYATNASPAATTLYLYIEGDTATRMTLPGLTSPADHAGLVNLDYASAGHTGFAPALGADDNYVTDAEKTVIGNTSGANTGDQDISGIATNAADIATNVTAIGLNTADSHASGSDDQDLSGYMLNTGDTATGTYTFSGNTGLGETSPDTRLHVTSSGNNNQLTLERDTSSTGKFQVYTNLNKLYFADRGTVRMTIDGANARVGIGDASPAHELDVYSATATTVNIEANAGHAILNLDSGGVSNDVRIQFQDDSASKWLQRFDSATGKMLFYTYVGATNLLTLTTDNRVGIGTTAPDNKLHIVQSAVSGASSYSHSILTLEENDSTGLQFLTPNDKIAYIFFGDPESNIVGYIKYDHATNDMIFRAGSQTNQLVLDGTGNVGIGVTNPSQKLQVETGYIYAKGSGFKFPDGTVQATASGGGGGDISGGGTTNYLPKFTAAQNIGDSVMYEINDNIGIGVSPNQKLTVEGTMSLKERASANTDTADYGQLWVKLPETVPATPQELWWTDDEGNDRYITGSGDRYWSCPGISFDAGVPHTDYVLKEDGHLTILANGTIASAPVILPQGVTIKSVRVYGNQDVQATWTIYKMLDTNGASSTMASAAINSADTSINYATIDNDQHNYYIQISAMSIDDEIWGAEIIYTL